MKKVKLFTILFAVILLAVGIASFSWFMSLDHVEIQSDKDMSISVGSSLEIMLHGDETKTWSNNLSYTTGANIVDCSGDGVNFFAPVTLDGNDAPLSMQKVEAASYSGFLLDTYLDVRSSSKMDLYLGSLSEIAPMFANGEEKNQLDNAPYSKGNIAGAVRVAFFEVSYNDQDQPTIGEPICVWAPNSKTELKITDGVPSVTYSGTPEASYSYYKNTTETVTYTDDDIKNGKLILAESNELCTADNGAAAINKSPCLLSFTEEGTLQVKHLLIRIWFEGTDRESNSLFNGGKVQYKISLAGVMPKAEQPQASIDALNALTFTQASAGVYSFGGSYDPTLFIYSKDGINWSQLGSGATFSQEAAASKVYVRLCETAAYKAGKDIREFTLPAAN